VTGASFSGGGVGRMRREKKGGRDRSHEKEEKEGGKEGMEVGKEEKRSRRVEDEERRGIGRRTRKATVQLKQ
jgi:hypothetical protein